MARREEQRAPRIPDLINLYIEQRLPRLSPRTASHQVSMLRNLVEPGWKTRLVADITPDHVEQDCRGPGPPGKGAEVPRQAGA